MTAASQEAVRTFLLAWRPLADLPPGNVARRSVLRFFETDDAAERREILERANPAARLYRIYGELGIRRPTRWGEDFERVLGLTADGLAAEIAAGTQRGALELLRACFEVGSAAAEARQQALRLFLLEVWGLKVGGPSMKYSYYANGVMFAGGGKTHEEMARDFVRLGLGSGHPVAGGQIIRRDELAFAYDLHSSAYASGDQRGNVADAFRRAIRASGAEEGRVRLEYVERLGVK